MREAERVIRRPVIDRLLQTGEPEPRTWSESVRALRTSLMRDIDWLLNTRRIAEPAPDVLAELQQSVYHYGLPDVSSLSADAHVTRRILIRQVEECLRIFEPRLADVRVSEAESPGEARQHQLHFVIEGVLQLHPESVPIVFDTVLDSSSGRFSVTGTA
jgi:type VI secretion system protein ImpF